MSPDFLMYALMVLIASIMAVRRVVRLLSSPADELKPNLLLVEKLKQTVQKTEQFKKLVKDFAPFSLNAEKRREKLIALYNECLTQQQYHVSTHSLAQKLQLLFNKATTNPRKYFNIVVFGIFLFVQTDFILAQTSSEELLQKANKAYDNGRYSEAIEFLQMLRKQESSFKKSVVCYKIAIAYQKLKRCDSATVYFKEAYLADRQKGGASSLDKFEEKLQVCGLSLAHLTSSSGEVPETIEQLIQKANSHYEQKEYAKALEEYLNILKVSHVHTKASVYYKIAITYQKLNDCHQAKAYFAQAYQKDPEKGGASSLDKFEEKIRACRLELADLQENTQADDVSEERQWITSIMIGIIAGFLIGLVVRKFVVTPLVWAFWFTKERIKLDIQKTILDTYFWKGLAAKYPEEKVRHLKRLFEHVARNVFDQQQKKLFIELKFHVDWLRKDPIRYLGDVRNDYQYFLRGMLPIDFYCFFTATYLVSGKTKVIAVVHPNGTVRKVWATSKIVRQLHEEKNPTIKVRVHKKDNQFVHWSTDETFFHFFELANANQQRMQQWQGESRNVSLQKFHDVFTNFPPDYIPPHPEAIADATIHYIPPTETFKTGFQPKDEPLIGTSADLSDIMTNVMMSDMIRDKDRGESSLRDLS